MRTLLRTLMEVKMVTVTVASTVPRSPTTRAQQPTLLAVCLTHQDKL
ncbi:hypothetical protein LEMLEM_LOCUS78 [Lemmus lemmus]